MPKKSCSKCKQQIIGDIHKVHGLVLCNDCFPFIKGDDGKLTWKQGQEGSLTFGKHGYKNLV